METTIPLVDPGTGAPAVQASLVPADKAGILTLLAVKRIYVRRALELCGGNKSEAAQRLGIDRSTIYELLPREGAES